MKTSGETIKPIIEEKNTTKKRAPKKRTYQYLETYKDLLLMQDVPVSVLFLERLGEDLVLWAKKAKKNWKEEDQDLKITPFFTERHIAESTYRGWRNKYPFFQERFLLAKQILGEARENGALRRKFDSATFLKSAPTYDPEWERLETWRAQLTEQMLKNEKQILEIREILANNGTTTPVSGMEPSEGGIPSV